MLKVILLDARQDLEPCEFGSMLSIVSSEKRERIAKFRNYRDAQNCLLGDLLARKMIQEQTGIPASQQVYSTNSHGKPFLQDDIAVHHNISHTGNWVVCALSNQPVGIDVQQVSKTDLNLAKRFFTEDEYNYILSLVKEQKTTAFYKMWSMKESFIKQKGTGLSMPLNSFSVIKMQQANEIYFHDIAVVHDVYCTACTTPSQQNLKRTDLKTKDIAEIFSKK